MSGTSNADGPAAAAWLAAAFFALPNLILLPGFQLQINVAAIATADQLSAITFSRERFQTGKEGFPIGYMEESELLEHFETIGR